MMCELWGIAIIHEAEPHCKNQSQTSLIFSKQNIKKEGAKPKRLQIKKSELTNRKNVINGVKIRFPIIVAPEKGIPQLIKKGSETAVIISCVITYVVIHVLKSEK